MDRYDGDGPRLHTLVATGLSVVLGPPALAAVLDGSSLLLGAVVVTGAAPRTTREHDSVPGHVDRSEPTRVSGRALTEEETTRRRLRRCPHCVRRRTGRGMPPSPPVERRATGTDGT
jgi:hypothetical protein